MNPTERKLMEQVEQHGRFTTDTRYLAWRHQVSVSTIRRAIRSLTDQGQIRRASGQGEAWYERA
jgi:DeoR/GlpR family transcriptional regulator of sugar metabolism